MFLTCSNAWTLDAQQVLTTGIEMQLSVATLQALIKNILTIYSLISTASSYEEVNWNVEQIWLYEIWNIGVYNIDTKRKTNY